MQCPACGATNPESAAWCGQCLARFDQPAPAPASAASPAPAQGTVEPTSSEGFRRVGDELQWACPQCGQFNSIDDVACVVCGTGFVERFRAAEEPEPPRNWNQALAFSALAPGAGHIAIGRYGSGWARLLLFVTWVIGAVLMGGSGGAGRAVVPLLLGAAVVWGGSLVDLRRIQGGQEELLAGRRLLWLVLGVLLLLGVALVTSALQILR